MSDKQPSAFLEDYFTKPQFAEALQKSEKTVERLLEKGLPYVELGGMKLIPKDKARDWLARGGTAAPVRRTRRRRAA